MAEERLGAAREYRSDPAAVASQPRPTHGIDATPDRSQPATVDPVTDRVVREAQRNELTTSNNAVLLARAPTSSDSSFAAFPVL